MLRKGRGRPRKGDGLFSPARNRKDEESEDGQPKGNLDDSESDREEEAIEGLTLYETYRQPLTPITDESTTSLQIRTLNVELTCPVCLGIIRRTMTVMECLHRFCADCISKSLRWGKKECPTCRVHCSSRRHLRPDPNFDALIAAVYPDLDEYEAQEDSFIADINRSLNRKALTESVERGIRRQAAASRGTNRKRKSLPPTSSTTPLPTTSMPTPPPPKNARATKKQKTTPKGKKAATAKITKEVAPVASEEGQLNPDHYHIRKKNLSAEVPQDPLNKPTEWVNFVFCPHPNERALRELDKKYLKMKRTATIRHLTLFLLQKFPHLESTNESGKVLLPLKEDSFRISIHNTETLRYVELPKELNLGTVESQHWHKREDMVLHFSLVGTQTQA